MSSTLIKCQKTDDFEGLYVSIYLRSRLYNSVATGDAYKDFTTPISQYYRINTATVNLGYSYKFESNIILESYIGLGVRSTTTSEIQSTNGTYNYNTQYESIVTKSITPTGVCCFRIGYAF